MAVGGKGQFMKCDRDCFHCKFDDCIVDDISKEEKEMQNYRDASLTVTERIPRGHYSKGQARKGGRYD